MDPKTKRFATSPTTSYADQLAAVQKQKMPILPAQAQQMLANVKFDVKTEHTGKTAEIQGIHAEENILVVTMEFPNPSGPGMQMRMEMHQWIAGPEAADRVPALKELEVYSSLPKAGLDPVEMMTKTLASFPGIADKLQGPLKDLGKNASKAMLRMQTAIYIPSMAAMLGSGAADQPFTEFNMELAELSSTPLPDSRFEVPADYQSAPMEEMLGVLFPSPKLPVPSGTPRAANSAGPQPTIVAPYKVGNGVTAPVVIFQTQPGYTEEARAAKIQGTVLLSLVVAPDGVPQQIKVLRSLRSRTRSKGRRNGRHMEIHARNQGWQARGGAGPDRSQLSPAIVDPIRGEAARFLLGGQSLMKKKVFRILGYVLAALIVLAGGTVTYLYARKPAMAPPSSLKIDRTPERLARGAYLYRLADCDGCHSDRDYGRFGGPVNPGGLAAGQTFPRELGLPGTVTAPNLTPDPETGLGTWSDGEKVRAIREGVDKDGRTLFPMMPYEAFRKMA